eukprot:4725183-Karenia_brevis.AAC.1
MRAGWGDYETQVRVARIGENVNKWETGRWVNTDICYRLDQSDVMEAIEDIEDAMETPRRIPKGARCRFVGWDVDGDVMLTYKGCRHVVFYQDLDKLSLV